jgi:hypothetical protein
MLSIANVKSGAQPESYYAGGDDYYNSKKEKAPSRWRGELARELGLEGPVGAKTKVNYDHREAAGAQGSSTS